MKWFTAAGRWLSANAFNLILSATLAVLVWIVAEQQANPSSERTFPTPIPIVLQHVPANMVTYDESASEVEVTLSTPEDVWSSLTADLFSATVDLGGQPTGTLDLPVQVIINNRGARITKIDPHLISLKMEPETDKRLPTTINVNGEPALGYSANPVKMTPAVVNVRGPLPLVEEVTIVSGQLSIQDARQTISQTVMLTPRDDKNQFVPYVSLFPSSTLAVVPINQLGGFRDLAVKIDLRGNVAPGHLTTDVSVDPQIVTVFGSSAALDTLPGFISTEPITVTDATSDINERARLVLLPGISMLGDPTVQVTVRIKPIEGSVNVQIPLTPQGLLPELSARVSPEMLDIILGGPIARLGQLQPNDVQAYVNVFNLITGTYQITPTVVAPNDINIVSMLPSTVQVVIGLAITPTITTTTTISPLLTPTPKNQTQ